MRFNPHRLFRPLVVLVVALLTLGFAAAPSLASTPPAAAPAAVSAAASTSTSSSPSVLPLYTPRSGSCTVTDARIPLHLNVTRISGGKIHVSATWGGDLSRWGPDGHWRLSYIRYGGAWTTWASTSLTSADFYERDGGAGAQYIHAYWRYYIGSLRYGGVICTVLW